MPTGYTATLYEGEQSFEDYAMGVARAFGALVTMRDDPSDAEIPEAFEPSSYYVDAVEEALVELDAATNASDRRLAERQTKEIADAVRHRGEYIAEREALRRRYEAMLTTARAYRPPTPEHEGFAQMLVQQLEESLRFDCGTYEPSIPDALPLDEYRDRVLAEARQRLDRARQNLAEEQERAEGRTAWVHALRESLKPEPTDA